MPIYEYTCGKCNHKFEELQPAETVLDTCPQCGAKALTRSFLPPSSNKVADKYRTSPARGWTRRPIADMVDLRSTIEAVQLGKIQQQRGATVNLRDINEQEMIHGVDDNLKDVHSKHWSYQEESEDTEY